MTDRLYKTPSFAVKGHPTQSILWVIGVCFRCIFVLIHFDFCAKINIFGKKNRCHITSPYQSLSFVPKMAFVERVNCYQSSMPYSTSAICRFTTCFFVQTPEKRLIEILRWMLVSDGISKEIGEDIQAK